MKAYLEKIIYVEAAHRNPAGGPAQQRLHGHSYRIELLSEGEVDPGLGWIVDYRDLKRLFNPIEDRLDHAYLNEIPGLEEDVSLRAKRLAGEVALAAHGDRAELPAAHVDGDRLIVSGMTNVHHGR